jgi:hypothetical protein
MNTITKLNKIDVAHTKNILNKFILVCIKIIEKNIANKQEIKII